MSRCLLVVVCLALVSSPGFAAGQASAAEDEGPLPAGAVRRLGTLRWRHDDMIGFASFLPDGKRVISVAGDLTIRVWAFPTGKEIRRINLAPANRPSGGFGAYEVTAALSKDGKVLATYCDYPFDGGADGAKIRLHEVATGKELRTLTVEDLDVAGLLFSPNGAHLLSVGYGGPQNSETIRIWDWAKGTQLRKFASPVPGTADFIRNSTLSADGGCVYSPDGNILLFMNRTSALGFLDLRDGKPIGLGGHTAPLQSVRFSGDGAEVITQATDRATHRWDARTGRDLGKITVSAEAQPGYYGNIRFSPDGQLAALISRRAQGPALIKLIDSRSGNQVSVISYPASGPADQVLIFAPGNKVVAIVLPYYGKKAPADAKVDLYEVASGKHLHTLAINGDEAKSGKKSMPRGAQTLFFSPSGRTLAWSPAGKFITFWDVTDGRRTGTLPVPPNVTLHNVAYSPCGRCLALEMTDGRVTLVELASAGPRRVFGEAPVDKKNEFDDSDAGSGPVRAPAGSRLAISPQGKLVARACPDRVVRIWNIATGHEAAAFATHGAAVTSIGFSPDGKMLASASADTTALLWNLEKVNLVDGYAKAPKAATLEEHWQVLAHADGNTAYTAMCALTASPGPTVRFFKDKIRPVALADKKQIEELISQLSHDQYKVREAATRQLARIGEQVVPALEKALSANPPLESRIRLEEMRGRLTTSVLQGDRLRLYRVVEVLERIGTAEARQLLTALAGGAPGTLLTTSARAALER